MAAAKPVAGIVRLISYGLVGGVRTANVFHVQCNNGVGPIALSDVTALATAARGYYKLRFTNLLANGFSQKEMYALDLTTDTGAQATISGTDAGGTVVSGLPNNVACCVTWSISRHYRGGHPRTYLPGIPGGAQFDVTSFTSSFITQVTTGAQGFRTDINAFTSTGITQARLCAVHRVRNKLVLDTPLVTYIDGASVDSRFDSQRRRVGRDR